MLVFTFFFCSSFLRDFFLEHGPIKNEKKWSISILPICSTLIGISAPGQSGSFRKSRKGVLYTHLSLRLGA